MTANAESVSSVTTYSYDVGSRLTGIDPPGTTNDAALTYDALARIRTRVVNGATDTYWYAGTGETVERIAGATTVDSVVDAAGNRLAAKTGSSLNWLVPDLHGNVAAQLDGPTAVSVAYATRYDPWGEIVDTGPNTGSSPVAGATWTYQGRLDVAPSGAGQPLLDGGARFYSPALGTFTSLDAVAGSAQDPLSMNRYLYAEANPATFIDPTGHCTKWIDDICADHRNGTNAVQKAHHKKWKEAEQRRQRSGANKPTAPWQAPRTTKAALDGLKAIVAGLKQASAPAPAATITDYRVYIDPDDLAADEGWRRLMDSSYNDIISGRYIGYDGLPTDEGRQAYAQYESLLGWQRDNERGFCGATGSLCAARAEARGLGILGAAELFLTGVAAVDPIPGDEIAAGGVDIATSQRIARVREELAVEASRLEGRATELSELLGDIARNHRVTAAGSTWEGPTVVGGGRRDLDPIQRRAAGSDITAHWPGEHAEPTVLQEMFARGLSPRALSMSGGPGEFCPACRVIIVENGGTIISPTQAVWYGPH